MEQQDAPAFRVEVPRTTSRTHWSVVLAAGKDSSPDAREAFGELYRRYLPPLLAFLRCKGYSHDAAMDVLHGFFEHLLETKALSRIEREGRFRCWLLKCLERFSIDEWRKIQAKKRPGDRIHFPIGEDPNEGEVEATDLRLTPEQAFDRKWAITLLKNVLARLQAEYTRLGKEALFAELKDFLPGGAAAASHAEIAARLRLKENSVTVAIKRLREHYRELLHQALSETVEADLVQDEWRHLQQAVLGR